MDVSVKIQANADQLTQALDSASNSAKDLGRSFTDSTNAGQDLSRVSLSDLNSNLSKLNASIRSIIPATAKVNSELSLINRANFPNLSKAFRLLSNRDLYNTLNDVNKLRVYLTTTNRITLKGIMGQVDTFSNEKLKRAITLTAGLGQYLKNTDKVTIKGLMNQFDQINYNLKETSRRTEAAKQNLQELDYKYRQHTLATMAQNVGLGDVVGFLQVIKRDSVAGKEFALAFYAAKTAITQFRPSLELIKNFAVQSKGLFTTFRQVITYSLTITYNAIVRFRMAAISLFTRIRNFDVIGTVSTKLRAATASINGVFNSFLTQAKNYIAPLKNSLTAFVKNLDVAPKLQGALNTANGVFTNFVSQFKSKIPQLHGYLTSFTRNFSAIPGQLGNISTLVKNSLNNFTSGFKNIVPAIKAYLTPIAGVFISIQTRLRGVFNAVSGTFSTFVNQFRVITSQMGNYLNTFTGNISAIPGKLKGFADSTVNVFNSFVTRFKSASVPIGNYLNIITTSFRAVPGKLRDVSTVIGNTFTALTTRFKTIATPIKGYLDVLVQNFNALPAKLQSTFNLTTNVFNNFVGKFKSFAPQIQGYLNSFVNNFNAVQSRLRGVFNTITSNFNTFITRFKTVITPIGNYLTVLANNFASLPGKLKGVFNATVNTFNNFVGKVQAFTPILKNYLEVFTNNFSGFSTKLKGVLGTVNNGFNTFITRFKTATVPLQGYLGTVTRAFSVWRDKLKATLDLAINTFNTFAIRVNAAITPIRNSLNVFVRDLNTARTGTRSTVDISTIFKDFLNRFRSVIPQIKGYLNTFVSGFNAIPAKLKGVFDTVNNTFNTFVGKFRTITPQINSYLNTLTREFTALPSRLRGALDFATNNFNLFLTKFRGASSAFRNNLNALITNFGTLPAKLKSVFESTTTVFNNFVTQFRTLQSPIRNYLGTFIGNFNAIPNQLRNLSTSVNSSFGIFVTRFKGFTGIVKNYVEFFGTFFRGAFAEFKTAFAGISWSSQASQIGQALRQGFARAIPLATSGISSSLTLVFRRLSQSLLGIFPNISSFVAKLAPLRAAFNVFFTGLSNAGRTAFTAIGRTLSTSFATEIPVRYADSFARLGTQVRAFGGIGATVGKTFFSNIKGVLTATNITALFMPLGGAIMRANAALVRFQMQIVKVIAAVGALGGGAIVMQISQMQQLESQLKAVTSSSAELQDTQEYLKATSNKLSIDIGVLSKSYIQLMNLQKSGLLDTEEARSIAEGFANVAAKTGASADDIGNSMRGMAQAFSSGVLQAEELGQMMDPLPGLLQAMDKASGEGAGGFRKLTYAGKVSSSMLKDTLLKAFKLYEGEAAKTSGNIIPMVTRMKNAFMQFAYSFNKPVTMSVQPIITGFTAIMDAIGTSVTKNVGVSGGFFSFLVKQFEAVGSWLGRIAQALPEAFNLIDLAPFYGMVNGLSSSLGSLFSGVFDLTQPKALAKILELILQTFVVTGKYLTGLISGFNLMKGVVFELYETFSKKSAAFSFFGMLKSVKMLIDQLSVLFNVIKEVAVLALLIGSFVILNRIFGQNAKAAFALKLAYNFLAPGVADLVLLTQKYKTQLISLGSIMMKLSLLFAAFTIGQWIGEWLWGFESVRKAAYWLMAGVLIVWASIKLTAKNAADYMLYLWESNINKVSQVFAYLGAALANPIDYMKSLWVDFVSYVRGLISEFIGDTGNLLSKLDFLPGMEGAAKKLTDFSQEMDKTTEEYRKVSLAGNEFTQQYQAQMDSIGDATANYKNNTLQNYRDFNSEYAEIVDGYNALTGKIETTSSLPTAPTTGGDAASKYEAQRKAYETQLVKINEIKAAIKKSQGVMQEAYTANVAYTESLASIKDARISDTIASMSDELDNFTKMVRLSNSEVMAGQTTNQATYEALTRSVRKHYADREAVVKQSVMTEEARATALKSISMELEQALADLDSEKTSKGGATSSPEIAIAKKQMEFSKQSIELEKQRMTVSVETANTIFTNNVKLIQMEGGTDAEKNKKIIAEQDKLLQAKIAAAKKGYEAVSQNLKKSTDDYIAYSEKAISLEQAIRGEKETLADKLREAERKGMDETKAQSDLQSQINEKLQAARDAMVAGDTERAKSLADQAESLGGQLTATDAMKNVLIESSAIREALLVNEKATVDTQKKMAADRITQETAVADQMKKTYTDLEDEIAFKESKVSIDASLAEITINNLQQKLNELQDKTVTVTVNTVEKKAIGGFAGLRFSTGARVPGIGNSDTVPAMLTPGEFVVRKSRATRFAGLLNYVNFGSDNQVAILQNYLRDGIQKLNLGGPVLHMPVIQRLNTGGNVTDAAQPQMVPVANLYLSSGKPPVTVYHPTDTAASVVNALQGMARGRL